MGRSQTIILAWILVAVFGQASRVGAQESKSTSPPTVNPWFVDDEQLYQEFMHKLIDLAKNGKCLSKDKLTAKLISGTKVELSLRKPCEKVLAPDEVYRAALPSVFILGSVHKSKEKGKEEELCEGMYATAWVAGEDGILVTNWHVFEELEEGEVFGAVDYKGNVYPVTDILGGDKVADVAVLKIDAKGLKPLPVAPSYTGIGEWVSVLGHPGDNFYVFTQGFVTRYSTNKNEDGKREQWMGVTAEYAGGSSGSPVLNKYGSVVGMAAMTLTIDGTPGAAAANPASRRLVRCTPPVAAPPQEKPDAKAPPKQDQKPGAGSSVQIILKLAVTGPIIYKSFMKP